MSLDIIVQSYSIPCTKTRTGHDATTTCRRQPASRGRSPTAPRRSPGRGRETGRCLRAGRPCSASRRGGPPELPVAVDGAGDAGLAGNAARRGLSAAPARRRAWPQTAPTVAAPRTSRRASGSASLVSRGVVGAKRRISRCGGWRPRRVLVEGETRSHDVSPGAVEKKAAWGFGEMRGTMSEVKATVDIRDELLVRARAQAARERTTLAAVVEEGLVLRLRSTAPRGGAMNPLPVSPRRGGLRPGIDGSCNRSLLDAADR